jgi:hypothetical protein
MHLSRAVLDGNPFMGEPTAASPVVYLTEQPLTSFREALRRADLLERDDFHVLPRLSALGPPAGDRGRGGREMRGDGCAASDR